MDSRNIPSQSSSYVGLLSQQGSVLHGNFPNESYHPSVHYPPFSSQQSEAPPLSEETPVDRKERKKWSPADDEVLISAWLNTSKDAIVGNDQNKGTFWKRVGEYYAATPHGQKEGERREHLHCKQRWHRINDLTNKFCGAVAAAERQVMGLDYSYSQPSQSEDYYGNSVDSPYSETEDLIRQDQAELSYNAQARVEYPPQPEVEFGFPQICYCGAKPFVRTSSNGRLYYTCANVDDGDCHVWKWWDEAVMEEMRARDSHVLQLAEKVDSLTILPDYETEQRMDRIEKIVREKGMFTNGFELFLGLTGLILVLVAVAFMFK